MKAKLSPLPGEPTEEPHSTGRLPNLKAGDVLRTVTNKDLQALLGPKVRARAPAFSSIF